MSVGRHADNPGSSAAHTAPCAIGHSKRHHHRRTTAPPPEVPATKRVRQAALRSWATSQKQWCSMTMSTQQRSRQSRPPPAAANNRRAPPALALQANPRPSQWGSCASEGWTDWVPVCIRDEPEKSYAYPQPKRDCHTRTMRVVLGTCSLS